MKLVLKNIHELNLDEFDLEKLSEYQKKKSSNQNSLASYYILDKYFDIDLKSIKYENGKPIIDNGYISISHKNNYVAVVYSDKNIGIDIEEIKEYRKSIEDTILSDDERDYIKTINDFYKIYTVKECVIKINNWSLKDVDKFSVINNKNLEYDGYEIEHQYFDNYILTIVEKL